MGQRIWVSLISYVICSHLANGPAPARPIYSLILGTKTMIVLSSDTAVKDLLDKRSAIYSDRPDMFIGQEIASGNHRLVLMVC